MLRLFEPQIKVQKDRQVVRQTDARMAKYSRRGLISHLLIYLLCLLFSDDFYAQHRTLVTVLSVGLLLTISVRGYLLFRFEALYPRAPAGWRSKYFLATLAGAAWWGIVVGSFTLYTDMQGVAPLLWLYTVVFFSTTAHAFAPYQRFLSVYQFLGVVPAALSTFFTGELLSVLYGSILLIFYRILTHHCELMARSYWERLEADYALARKTESVEEEKRDTRASVALTKEFMSSLNDKMQAWSSSADVGDNLPANCKAELSQLGGYVDDFNKILCKQTDSHSRTFNVRRYVQAVAGELIETAELKRLELETALSLALPARLIGDAARLGQILRTMIRNVIEQTDKGLIFIEVEFVREYEDSGHLQITVVRQLRVAKRSVFQGDSVAPLAMGIDLVVAKGFAESQGGTLEIAEGESRDGKTLRLSLPMGVAAANPKLDYQRPALKGKSVLLVHAWPRWLEAKRLELEVLGFSVTTATDFKKAQQDLQESLDRGSPFGSVVYVAQWGDDSSSQFANVLLSHNQLKYTHQFAIGSGLGKRYFQGHLLRESPLLHFVPKPSGMFEFELAANAAFDDFARMEPAAASGEERAGKKSLLWVALGKSFENTRPISPQGIPIEKVGDMKNVVRALNEADFDLVLIEYTGENVFESLRAIRAFEASKGGDYFLPTVGVGPAQSKIIMMESGCDHFVDVEDLLNGDTSHLRYWLH